MKAVGHRCGEIFLCRRYIIRRAKGHDPVCAALAGGDDYELLFTARPTLRGRLRAVKRQAGDLPITKIGVVTKAQQLVLRTASGDSELPAGFEHFR